MAIVYSATKAGYHYEVRSAGRTRRLYTNGVFHSQYNPNHIITGSVWDLLFLPSQFYQPDALQRILVLGVGGGAVVHMLNRFCQPAQIVGIELNPMHIRIAKNHFDLRYPNFELVQADAIRWMTEYDGEPFDLIIDDLYGESEGEPSRAICADEHWFDVLMDHLTEQGGIVMNFVDYREWLDSAYFASDFIRSSFPSVYQFATSTCHNAVVGFLPMATQTKELRSRLQTNPILDPNRATCRLRYAVKKIA